MKYLAALILMHGFAASAMAANPACERKEAEIERQIEHAKAAGNHHRLRGLENALSSVRAHCTDAKLIEDKKRDIAEQQEEIDEVLEEIREKESEGRYDKVQKLERKLERERAELKALQQELQEIEKH